MSDVHRFTTIQNLRAFVEAWPEDALQDSSINDAPVIKVVDILYAYDALVREVEDLKAKLKQLERQLAEVVAALEKATTSDHNVLVAAALAAARRA